MERCLDVELVTTVRPPVEDPTLGIPVTLPPRNADWTHRLVTIGDSLTHGFQHFAIYNTEHSWPAMVARQLGTPFAFPTYRGPGGFPLNLECVARKLDTNLFLGLVRTVKYLLNVKKHYTAMAYPGPHSTPHEDLAIFGWDLRDTLVRTADTERALIGRPNPFIPMVNAPGHRAAVSVLNSARDASGLALTPLAAARKLGNERGGIETLCVWLGANNVLPSVVSLNPQLSRPDYTDLAAKTAYTVWTVRDFTAELALVAAEVRRIKADHVLWATVPHVTIPPIAQGLGGRLPENDRYFCYYGRLWENEHTFKPRKEGCLTGKQAWAIDLIIDGYNYAIEDIVRNARKQGYDWRIVDICAVLDRLAVRRNQTTRPAQFPPYPLPAAIKDLDTRYFTTDTAGKLRSGGLIGLDGVHPTTCGYGIVAQEFINVMVGAQVQFKHGTQLDFAAIREADTLVSQPPARIDRTIAAIRHLDFFVDLLMSLDPFRAEA